jgi:hypothetical protein
MAVEGVQEVRNNRNDQSDVGNGGYRNNQRNGDAVGGRLRLSICELM